MAILVSPGVSVTVTNESFYASAGTGTVPLIVIATAENKFQPGSSTAIASGTIKENAGKLYLTTSQRDALQTFGLPNYYSVAGTPQYDNELNEHGLFALYDYLGIANSAYVIRADVDLAQLEPSSTEPVGMPGAGDYWFDINNTSWGIFKSNGDPNSAYTWQAKVPTVINSKSKLEKIVQGRISGDDGPLSSPTASLISVNGVIKINDIEVSLLAGDTITGVMNKINGVRALAAKGISAVIFVRQQKYYPDASNYGDVYNLRIVSADVDTTISLSGSTSAILEDLGFVNELNAANESPKNFVLPKASVGADGDFAVDVMTVDEDLDARKNSVWQKISQVTNSGTTAWWFKVGSVDANYPGWGWRDAEPRVITGNIPNPVFIDGESVMISVDNASPFTVYTGETLDEFISNLNSEFNSQGVNVIAKKNTVGNNSYLQIVNFDSTDLWLHDVSDHTGSQKPLSNAGVSTSQTYVGSVTGTVADPVFNAPEMFVSTASVVDAGSGYEVNDTLTVNINGTSAAILRVDTIKAVDVEINGANKGTGYRPRDTITINDNNNSHFLSPVILRVKTVDNAGGITSVTILQAGQFNSSSTPANYQVGVSSGSGIGAQFNLTWGVGSVSVTTPGETLDFPSNPVSQSATSGSGTGAQLNLSKGYTSSDVFSIDLGNGIPVEINVPGTTLDDLVVAINAAFPTYAANGLDIASIVTSGASDYLKISNPNGTNFILKDISGTPLNDAGIKVGYTFGRKLIYQGYSPSLTVPDSIADIAANNIWINTTASNRGAAYVVKQYQNDEWVQLNTAPNTGTIPVYSSASYADIGFGSSKTIGSIFMLYNATNVSPVEADFVLKVWDGTQWADLDYTPSVREPVGTPAAGTYWYNTNMHVDIMVSNGQVWQGYLNAYPGTDPNGPIISGSKPYAQSDNTPLVDYDIWIDTSDLENYPKIHRYNVATRSWKLIDNTDHTSAAGIIFADARETADGTATGGITPSTMAKSNYVDDDAPSANLHPRGLILFNTRYSTNNVKVWVPDHFPLSDNPGRWVTASGNKADGTPYMGHWAQRNIVVQAIKAAIAANQDVRAEQAYFNLLACPGYTETLSDLVVLNTDKKETAFVIGDTPARLQPDSTNIQDWTTNVKNAATDGSDGLVTHNEYVGIYYPWGIATNIDGSSVFVPPSVMALRTYAYNDQVAYPWLAPAGFTRGVVTGVSNVGYLTEQNTFRAVQLSQGQRDVMYINGINPIAYIPNRGLIIYGQKTLAPVASAMDRVNVARLINYLNFQLDNLGKPFLFEPNDQQTRRAAENAFTSFMSGLIGVRALYDFAVVCDESNNTPERIDRNELWVDVAIKPEKAIEFIYIPIRLLNTSDPMPEANRSAAA